MSLVLCDRLTGEVVWTSQKEELGRFLQVLSSLVSTSQPSDAVAVTVHGVDYVAVSYPHQYKIKLYKSEYSHWRKQLQEYAVAYHGNDFKPDQMCCAGDELVVLEYRGPAVQMGMYKTKLHVLNTTAVPFQHIRSISPDINMKSFCVLPSPAFNRLFYCVSGSAVVAVDMYGNCYWAVNDLRAKGVCADERGFLYVTSGPEGDHPSQPVLHVLWHDGTILQTFTKADLNLIMPSKIVFDHRQRSLIIADGTHVSVLKVKYTSN